MLSAIEVRIGHPGGTISTQPLVELGLGIANDEDGSPPPVGEGELDHPAVGRLDHHPDDAVLGDTQILDTLDTVVDPPLPSASCGLSVRFGSSSAIPSPIPIVSTLLATPHQITI